MFNKILVGMDGFVQAQHAFDDALFFAQKMGGSLKLLHVFSFDDVYQNAVPHEWFDAPDDAEEPDRTIEHLTTHWRQIKQRDPQLLQSCRAEAQRIGVTADIESGWRHGHPGQRLCDAARQWEADLIVVGHRDKPHLGGLRLGSVSSYVLHHAPCSVLVSHRHLESAHPSSAGRLEGMQRILVAMDLSDMSRVVFEEALTLARATGAQLTLLHVWSPFEANYPAVVAHPEIEQDFAHERDLNRYAQPWESFQQRGQEMLRSLTERAINEGIPITTEQRSTDPGQGIGQSICAIAQEQRADLILLGRRGLSGLQELTLGSVSYYVTYHAACAVLTISPRLLMKADSLKTSASEASA